MRFYCYKCNREHKKKEVIEKCKEYVKVLTNTEIFIENFRKSMRNYSIDKHKQTRGSKK